LRQYHAEYDDKLRTFKTSPRHDWTSHCADAFRYMAMAWREMSATPAPEDKIKALMTYKPTVDDLFEEIETDDAA